jgi:hypothetical protein
MTARDKPGDYGPTEPISPSLQTSPRRFRFRQRQVLFASFSHFSFYYGAVLRIEFKRTDFLDLGPYTDAVEYFVQGKSILKEGSPTVQIGYHKLPSRYPPGYSILMIPGSDFCRKTEFWRQLK